MAKKPRPPKLNTAERKAYMKENYRLLREAGFSVADATRLRNSSPEYIRKALEAKVAPPIQEKKRGKRGKTKLPIISRKEWAASEEINISVPSLSLSTMNRIFNYMKFEYENGFAYFYVVVTFHLNDGTHITNQSYMKAVIKINSGKELQDIIKDLIKKFKREGSPPVDDEEIDRVEIDVKLWKAKGK